MDRAMSSLSAAAPRLATEMARLQLTIQSGQQPDAATVGALADDITRSLDDWESLLLRWQTSQDFQSREYFELTAARLDSQGQSFEQVSAMMRWQVDGMRAFATGAMPPMPPAGVDMQKMMEDQQTGRGGMGASQAMMMGQQSISASPFGGNAFESELVRAEYEALGRDHSALIRMGEQYGSFDPLGKLAYLDALEAVEERWDVFFSRFALLGALNTEYREQSAAFLLSLGLSGDGLRELLRKAHERMRAVAKHERDR